MLFELIHSSFYGTLSPIIKSTSVIAMVFFQYYPGVVLPSFSGSGSRSYFGKVCYWAGGCPPRRYNLGNGEPTGSNSIKSIQSIVQTRIKRSFLRLLGQYIAELYSMQNNSMCRAQLRDRNCHELLQSVCMTGTIIIMLGNPEFMSQRKIIRSESMRCQL